MNILGKIMGSCMVVACSYVGLGLYPQAYASSTTNQAGSTQNGLIEFRVGSIKSEVIGSARVIVINHEGKVITTGLTNSAGSWTATVPYFKVEWNEHFSTKGVVTAMAMANGYNEQVVFIVPITKNTIQPIVLQPIVPNGRNEPSASLGMIYHHELNQLVDRYAEQLKLVKQPPIPGGFGYAPWGPARKSGDEAR